MKDYIKIILLAIPFSFLIGLWWSFYRFESTVPHISLTDESIKILAEKDVFPPKLISEFERTYKISVELTEASNPIELINSAVSKNRNFDLIQLSSYHAQVLSLNQVFQKLNDENIEAIQSISPDFLRLEYDSKNSYVLPLAWGINGFATNLPTNKLEELTLSEFLKLSNSSLVLQNDFLLAFSTFSHLNQNLTDLISNEDREGLLENLKRYQSNISFASKVKESDFKSEQPKAIQIHNGQVNETFSLPKDWNYWIPKDGADLWIKIIGISRSSNQKESAESFLSFILKESSSFNLSFTKRLPTTVRGLDSSPLPDNLKARFIRSIEASRIKLPKIKDAYQSTWRSALVEIFPDPFNFLKPSDDQDKDLN